MRKKATYIKTMAEGFRGEARLYSVDPPVRYDFDWETKKYTKSADYIIVSAAIVMGFGGGPETYVFPANSDGKVVDWGELDGSFKGGLNHEKALRGAGYKVVEG